MTDRLDASSPVRSRRPRVRSFALVFIVGVVAFMTVNYRTLIDFVMTRVEVTPWEETAYWDSSSYFFDMQVADIMVPLGREERSVHRWTGKSYGPCIDYYQDTGIQRRVDLYDRDGKVLHTTHWFPDGRVSHQWFGVDGKSEMTEKPPWKFGAVDQSVPAGTVVEPHGVFRRYRTNTAILAEEEHWQQGVLLSFTHWAPDGSIEWQGRIENGLVVEEREAPPWWGDVAPQVLDGTVLPPEDLDPNWGVDGPLELIPTAGVKEILRPLRRRGDGPPVWFYADPARSHAQGDYVDGKKHGLWTYWRGNHTDEYTRFLQRRFDSGELVEERTDAPWWPVTGERTE